MNQRTTVILSFMGVFLIAVGSLANGPATALSVETTLSSGITEGFELTAGEESGSGSVVMALGVVVTAALVAGIVLLWYLQQNSSQQSGTDTVEISDVQTELPSEGEPEQLSDEDIVIDLLESHGGRMKQGMIVDETDWSKSKVSMLLSEMEDDELISKLRVGRENIISLPGHEPDAVGSPFDTE